MTSNPLTGLLSPKVRRYVYAALFLAGVVVACLELADVPTGAAVEIIAYLGTALGAVAASNTPSPEASDYEPRHRGEEGASDVVTILAVVVLVLVILALVGLI